MLWFEPSENLGSEFVREFEQGLAADAAAEEHFPGKTQRSSTSRSQSAHACRVTLIDLRFPTHP
eukprot:1880664-Pleurochrysis_carterae.AAC.1